MNGFGDLHYYFDTLLIRCSSNLCEQVEQLVWARRLPFTTWGLLERMVDTRARTLVADNSPMPTDWPRDLLFQLWYLMMYHEDYAPAAQHRLNEIWTRVEELSHVFDPEDFWSSSDSDSESDSDWSDDDMQDDPNRDSGYELMVSTHQLSTIIGFPLLLYLLLISTSLASCHT